LKPLAWPKGMKGCITIGNYHCEEKDFNEKSLFVGESWYELKDEKFMALTKTLDLCLNNIII
jgi:hypothetical protein